MADTLLHQALHSLKPQAARHGTLPILAAGRQKHLLRVWLISLMKWGFHQMLRLLSFTNKVPKKR